MHEREDSTLMSKLVVVRKGDVGKVFAVCEFLFGYPRNSSKYI